MRILLREIDFLSNIADCFLACLMWRVVTWI